MRERVGPGIASIVKTSVVVPDDLHERAERLARRLGIARGRLYVLAVAEYVAWYEPDPVTERLNRVYAKDPAEPDSVLLGLAMQAVEVEEW